MVSTTDIRAAYIRQMLDSIMDMGDDERVRPADLTMDHLSDLPTDIVDDDLEVAFERINTQVEDGSLPLPPDHILGHIGRFVASSRNLHPDMLREWAEISHRTDYSPATDDARLIDHLIEIVIALGPQRWRFDGTQVVIAAPVRASQAAAV